MGTWEEKWMQLGTDGQYHLVSSKTEATPMSNGELAALALNESLKRCPELFTHADIAQIPPIQGIPTHQPPRENDS